MHAGIHDHIIFCGESASLEIDEPTLIGESRGILERAFALAAAALYQDHIGRNSDVIR